MNSDGRHAALTAEETAAEVTGLFGQAVPLRPPAPGPEVSWPARQWTAERTVEMHQRGSGRCAQCPEGGGDCPGLAAMLAELDRDEDGDPNPRTVVTSRDHPLAWAETPWP